MGASYINYLYKQYRFSAMIGPAQIPNWFRGGDSIIDFFSIFILLLISFFSLKYYRIKKNRNYVLLSISFILLAVSFLLKVLINIAIYTGLFGYKEILLDILHLKALSSSGILGFLVYLIYHLAAFFGLFAMYLIYQKQSKTSIMLISYLIFISAFFSNNLDSVFHFTYFIMLVLITSMSVHRYLSKRYPATRLMVLSLFVITLSQLFFVLSELDKSFYIAAQFTQLLGYVVLLIVFIAVLIYGRKEDKDRYNW